MNYHDGSFVALGDIVSVPIPTGNGKARVVMLGDSYEHLDIEKSFVSWVKRDKVLDKNSIVIEWTEGNPFQHDDPKYAPVGKFMFTPLDQFIAKQK